MRSFLEDHAGCRNGPGLSRRDTPRRGGLAGVVRDAGDVVAEDRGGELVELGGEGVEVWRPVRATCLGEDVFRLDETSVPAEEDWEFRPGDAVQVVMREDADGPVRIACGAVRVG